MHKKGGFITKIKITIFLVILFTGFFCAQNVLAEELININTASFEELDTLPGIGPSKAQAIIDYRELNGPFQTIEEITNVSGIGAATLENIKDLITVGGIQEEVIPEVVEDEPSDESQDPIAEPVPQDNAGLQDDSFGLGDVVINEFISDPADEEVEWIELYNTTNQVIDLTGWSIEEGSGAKTSLTGEINKFFIIEKPKGNLNNKGDIIILRDAEYNLIDKVEYGDWDACPEQCLGDGLLDNNAPVVGDPFSVARKFDGQNSYNNKNDFLLTTTPTKGESNIITDDVDSEAYLEGEMGDYDYSDDIIITEIFPNPFGSDTEAEFIELYNSGDKDINLNGWRLGDESKKRYEFKEDIIKPEEYLVIYRSESKIALNNTNDSVKLFAPGKDESLEIIKYEKAVEGWSYAKALNHKWSWTEAVSPGEKNIIKTINYPPEISFYSPDVAQVGTPILFDSSDTIDEDENELKFAWDFGDGFTNNLPIPEHTYFKEGDYVIKLVVSDGENEEQEEKAIRIVSNLGIEVLGVSNDISGNIIISEFLPNPEGNDLAGEFIEILNKGENKINLLNWSLDDGEGGSKPYKFVDDTWLMAGDYFLVERDLSRLALNNTNDAVRLYNNFEELIEEIEYEQAVEGQSFSRGKDGEWFWTSAITPEEENIVFAANNELENLEYFYTESGQYIIETTLEEVKNFVPGDLIIVKGTVAVLPGILGSQYFYIVAPTSNPPAATRTAGQASPAPYVAGERSSVENAGVQVYSYKKDFPNLRVGDYIEVAAELSVVSGEIRLKTKEAHDMQIIEHREEPLPREIKAEEIDENYVGQLVKITGEIVERKSSIIYLDDGYDEVLVYLKTTTGINAKNFSEGEIVEITGIVGSTKSGIRIMPRGLEDIIKKDVESNIGNEGKVLGEVAESNQWAIEARNKKLELFKYLLIIAGGVVIVLSALLFRATKVNR